MVKRNLRSGSPDDGDAGASALTTLICNAIDNESRMVIQADSVDASPYGSKPGKFGVTEPDPCA